MTRKFHYIISNRQADCTVLQYLKNLGYSRGMIVHLKKTPLGICRNGVHAYVSETLSEGDVLDILLVEEETSEKILPTNIPLNILYEDEDIFVINKPAGMPVHPSINHYTHTLANALAAYNKEKGVSMVFRCINRLDRDTSGLTIIAKHMLSAAVLGNDMKNRKIHREYLGIADGFVVDCGTIDAPIARKKDSVLERTVDFENGETAVTHFQCLKRENGLSLVSFRLETGRTHQIRVHMNYNHTPLIGDFLYHPTNRQMERQALHAWRLAFTHPITGEALSFEAPIPDDFILEP